MEKYECSVCGYVYDQDIGDSEGGIDQGTKFETIPAGWICPLCGSLKEKFKKAQ